MLISLLEGAISSPGQGSRRLGGLPVQAGAAAVLAAGPGLRGGERGAAAGAVTGAGAPRCGAGAGGGVDGGGAGGTSAGRAGSGGAGVPRRALGGDDSDECGARAGYARGMLSKPLYFFSLPFSPRGSARQR